MANSIGSPLLNVLRGALIGTSEVVPGVSGGTIALIVGIYERLITSAGHVLSGVKLAATDLPQGRGGSRASAEFRRAEWGLVLAVLVGMLAAALLGATFLAPLVEEHQQRSYALFFGLVLASLWVPYSGSGRAWSAGHYLLALAVAAGAFVLTGLPPSEVTPNPVIVFGAAAVAICALVLPGMSGSFLLLTFGLYTATMDAVSARDFGYLGVFAVGAVFGLAFFVKLLQWLLEHQHRVTLVVMTGILAGSLRALWPWQDEDRALHAPAGDVAVTVALMVVGFVTVAAVLLIARRAGGDDGAAADDSGAPEGAGRV
ncbi:putative membrane protein [Haloactinospora alba]|uniref:Putative membrane protein n=1 Tax=Haloactinospora alba TaxID=405555 RepID=A0A543NGJ2_9ACTN|nr:DUF368 domain-containing protein [Haloactinospora alba]TQN30959.1 putative membrane protein [Haloactinospora alba]